MDIVESIKKDKAYMKCKLIVKNWEKEFKIKHSRTPSKFDIKEAPTNIKYAYKKYFHLKSSFLENSLNVCDIVDEPLGSPDVDKDLESFASESDSLQCEPILPDLPSGPELHKLLSDANIQKNIKDTTPFVDNLSKKLFHNRTFSLRNPRKLSLTKSQSIVDAPPNNVLVDSCNIKGTEPKSSLTIENTDFFVGKQSSTQIKLANNKQLIENVPPLRQLNEAWLQRAVDIHSEENFSISKSPAASCKFGLSNIILPNAVEKANDYVENSESEEDLEFNKLKPALKKRKLNYIASKEILCVHSKSQDNSSISEVDIVMNSPKKSKRKVINTQKPKHETGRNTDSNNPPDIHEYIPFGLEEDINPRHNNVIDILNKVALSTKCMPQHLNTQSENKIKDKIKNGTLNENFVKINIEKKVFVRGKKNINFSKYKKQLWKDKKALNAGMEFPENGKINCFKCGMTGHMARYCTAHKGDTLLPLESYDDNNLPTLEEMQHCVSQSKSNVSEESILSMSVSSSKIPDSFLKMLADSQNNSPTMNVKPIYDRYTQETPQELYDILEKFGHKSFRQGQEKAIMRILCGMSTLLILSTGGGKSLCYQLPAYVYSQYYKCVTLVISPLVSLMEDQVLSMPDFLKAGCLHTNQPPTQRKKIIQCLKDGDINILLISPEALISGDTTNGFAGLFKSLPKIAFACIDEAHCVSQWSHNFRPSYLMICRVLREKLNVHCILGLTATASQPTIQSVIGHLNVPDGENGVITNPTLPDNLILSMSFEKDKDRALVSYLTSEKIKSFNSIIVYCIRRDECERVASILRSSLQEPNKINMEKPSNKRKRMSYIAEAYHAGMSAAQRKKIQKHFMEGTVRIIVATVAFGMGINKSNIRCIIHYNMPSSFESYVQEVGRAGRDGHIAYCHVFLSSGNSDQNELLKHIHANTIDRPIIRKLLQKVFIPCECGISGKQNISANSNSSACIRCKGHEVGIPIDNTVEELDLPSENIATLLCYVELHPKHYIKVLNNAYTICKVSSYAGSKEILTAAKNCPPLAMAVLLESKKDPDTIKKSILVFNVIEVAAAIGLESGMAKYQLKNLEWVTDNGTTKRSQLKVEFNTLGFRIKSPGDLSSGELDDILNDLHNSVLTQEKTKLCQLKEITSTFSNLGSYSIGSQLVNDNFILEKSTELKNTIRNYFQRDNTVSPSVTLELRPLDIDKVKLDVRALISSYKDCEFTGRSIARIFQGISSPNYPAIVWGRCRFWRSHIHEDFYGIVKVATEQILEMKII